MTSIKKKSNENYSFAIKIQVTEILPDEKIAQSKNFIEGYQTLRRVS
ncbi:hypothetical protein [Chryseobacterium balustinum]